MLARVLISLSLVLAAGLFTHRARGAEQPPGRTPLSQLSISIGGWQGYEAPPFADDVIAQLGVDDYINRFYASAAGAPIALYAGYYASQRQGDTIHSPQNCLPGAGWQPIFSDRYQLRNDSESFEVNRVLIAKGQERQAVLYWYQGRQRIVASEFANKGLLMLDAARLRRTDGGLVRLMTPIGTSTDEQFSTLSSFAAALIPLLWAHIP
jgi:EpsI family protein